jgi:NTF2-related export protein 1/2
MAELAEDTEVRIAAEGDVQSSHHIQYTNILPVSAVFIEQYYDALTRPGERENLSRFYLTPSATQSVDITFNGAIISSPTELQETFTKNVDRCTYDIQTYDVHVTNKDYKIGRPEGLRVGGNSEKDVGRRMSMIITVSGIVRYGTSEDKGEQKVFSDVIFLVPNWNSFGGKAGAMRARKYVIQNQTFRIVAS